MCDTITLEKGVLYKIVRGPAAGTGALGSIFGRKIPLEFFVELPQKKAFTVVLDITDTERLQSISPSSGLYVVGIKGTVYDHPEQKFSGEYNPAEHTGTLRFS